MKGSHQVEEFLDWIEKHPTMPVFTKVTLSRKIKNAADRASLTGKQGVVQIKRAAEICMVIRVFGDGSLEVGWPADLKQKGDMIPPPRKEI